MNDRPTTDWIPSHVEITIHQGRELLLKNKNANSELYVSIQVERERFTTGLIPRDTAPQWNFISEIPLMSLDTTIHLTVRQKGRLGDQFIGHIPIPLRNFNISSKLVTHWYKLGSRPGKVKNKLRGDIQVSIRFLSNWSRSSTLTNGASAHQEDLTFDPAHSPSNNRRSGRMLAKSKSDMRVKVQDVMATGLLDGGKSPSTPPLPTVRDRLSSAIRRSFRKKNKAPAIFQECEDDFTFSHSPSITPVLKKRSNTVNSLLYPHSDSDSTSGTPSEVSQSPATVRHPSIQVASSSTNGISVGGGGARESESSGDNQEEASAAVRLREKEDNRSEWQRGSKRRWTMNTLPLISTASPLTTPTSNSTHVPGLSPSHSSSPFGNSDGGSQSPTEDSTNAENTVLTYRAKSNTLAVSPHLRRSSDRSRSYSITSSQGSVRSALLVELQSVSESCSEVTTPTSSSRRNLKDHSSAESGYSTGSSGLLEGVSGGGGSGSGTNVGKSSVVSEESGSEAGNSGGSKMEEQSKTSRKTTTSSRSTTTTTPAGNKRPKQLTRRNTSAVSNPSRSRGAGHLQARSRLESTDGSGATSMSGRGASSSSRGRSTTEPNSHGGTPRRKTLSPPSAVPNRKLQPAAPVRRSEKAHLAATRPKSMIATTPTTTTTGGVSLAESNKGAPKESPSKETNSQLTEENQVDSKATDSPTSADDETSSQLGSRTDENSGKESDTPQSFPQANSADRKIKHTVAYKDTSPLYKDGFQPAPLLPPSMTEYQSQTLPLRGKLARRRSTEADLSKKLDTLELHADDRLLSQDHTVRPMSTDSAHRINRSPQNTKLIHRSSMNYVIGGNQKKTPPILVPSGSLDETDSAAGASGGDSLLMEGVCSKSSITSVSSTSTSSRPSTPSTPKYGTKSPGEIVTSALRNKSRPRPTGYIRKAIGMYQENKRQLRRSLEENKRHSCFLEEVVEDSDKQMLLQPGRKSERVSASAGNSPQQLRRNRSAAETLTGLLKNPFNSLRRSKSTIGSSRSPSSRRVSMIDMGDLGISPDLLERVHSSKTSQLSTSLEVVDPSIHQKTSAPALLAYRASTATASGNSVKPLSACTGVAKSDSKDNRKWNSKGATSEPIIRVRTPSITESSSVKTLTELDTSLRESASSPNPAGASPMSINGAGSGHSRHTTCSSVDSEGFVSVTSEELTLEELAHQDWSQWSKEDLHRELILSKQALRRKDQELKDIKGYLDNLLLRIMESNPTLLSSSS